MMFTTRLLLAIALAQLCAALPASAQPYPAGNTRKEPASSARNALDNATDLDTVTVQGARYDARRDDTATRIVIGKEDLQRFGDVTLPEALKRLPGVTVGTGAPGRSGTISLRGLGAAYTQILINGEKAPAGFDLDSLTSDMIERIEIIRSPTADLRAEAIAGTINIVLTDVARKDSSKFTFAWGTSNDRHTPSIAWQHARRDDYRSRTLAATLSQREFLVEESGIESGQDAMGKDDVLRTTSVRATGFRNALSLAPTLNVTMESGDTFVLQGYMDANRYNRSADIDWNTLLGPELKHTRYRQITDIGVIQLQGSATWIHEFEKAGKLTTKMSLGGNREGYAFREQGYAIDGQQNLDDHTDSDLHVGGINTTGKYSLPTLGDHGLQLGWEWNVDRRREARIQHLLPVGGEPEAFSDLSFDAHIRRLAVYGQDDVKITPSWSMYLGLRWENIETSSDGSGFVGIRNRVSVLSPVLQSLWKIPETENDQVRLALSHTYKTPTIASLIPRPYTSTNNRALNPDQQGNPDLRPELATGLDVSYEKYWGDGAQVSVGAYLREIEGVVRTETRFRNGRWIASPVNGGDATAWGMEMDTKFALPQLVSGAPNIDIRFNATRNWSTVDGVPGPDNRMAQQIKFSSTLGADYKISPTWTTGISYSHRSGGLVRTTPFQTDFEAARRDLDLFALWSGKRTKLRLSASNGLHQNIDSGQWYVDTNGTRKSERLRRSPVIFRMQVELQL